MTRILRRDHSRCSVCGAFFNSTRAFDKHRVGGWLARRCLTAEDMLGKGMVRSATGWWLSSAWKQPVLQTDAITGAAIGSAPSVGSRYDHDRHGAPISQHPFEVSP
jgi:hypothetical protein